MEADESYNSEEAQPPSCIAPNANGGQDALVFSLKGSTEGFSYCTSCNSCSLQRMSIKHVSFRYSLVLEPFIDQGIPMRFAEQSSCIKGGDL